MNRYLISFPSGAMDHLREEEWAGVADAAHAVIREAKEAGVCLFSGGLDEQVPAVMVSADGTVAGGTYPETKTLNGGFTDRGLLARVRPGVGRDDCDRLPLCPRGSGVPVRPPRVTKSG